MALRGLVLDRSRAILILAAAAVALALGSAPAVAADYFVDPAGADANSGLSPALAFATVQKGADTAAPGDTVHLQPGTYAEAVRLTRSGTAASPITFVADGSPVVLDGEYRLCPPGKTPPAAAPRFGFVANAVHDVVLDGIEVTRYCYTGLVFQFSNAITIRNLNVHHNGVTLRSQEGNGIAVQGGANVRIENNLVTDNAPKNKKSGTGIAVDGTDQAIVRNNIADRNNGNGILIEDGTNVLVEGNVARFNLGEIGSWGTAGSGWTGAIRSRCAATGSKGTSGITDETPSDPYGYERLSGWPIPPMPSSRIPEYQSLSGWDATDYDGHLRPLAAGPDIGAFEGGGPCGAGRCVAGAPRALAYASSVHPVNPVTVTIPVGQMSVTRSLNVRVRNDDDSPRDRLGHRIQLRGSDGDCPAGTITGVPAFRRQRVRGPESAEFLAGGRRLTARVLLTFPRAAFVTVSHCTLRFTAVTPMPGNVDPDPGNDSVAVDLYVSAP